MSKGIGFAAVAALIAALQAGCAQTRPVASAPPTVDDGTVIAASLGYHGPAGRQPGNAD